MFHRWRAVALVASAPITSRTWNFCVRNSFDRPAGRIPRSTHNTKRTLIASLEQQARPSSNVTILHFFFRLERLKFVLIWHLTHSRNVFFKGTFENGVKNKKLTNSATKSFKYLCLLYKIQQHAARKKKTSL